MHRLPTQNIGRVRILSVLLTGFLLLPPALPAQELQVNAVSAPVNALSIGDVDFINSSSPKWLFTIDINTGGRSIMAVMTIGLDATLASGEHYPQAIQLVTKSFEVASSRTITNLDIGTGRPIGDSLYFKDPTAKEKFEAVALPSGIMPAGVYKFLVQVTEISPGSSTGSTDFVIDITNPSTVELLFPSDGEQTVSQLPLFQWMFDGSSSRIAIFEKLPSQSSLEEAVNGDTVLAQDVPATVFQYPSAGVRSLQPGRTYVWFVEGHVGTAGGINQRIRSPLRSFKVEAGQTASSSILDELERVLDPKYKPVFDQIRADGLMPFGSALVNGSPASGPDLARLLAFIRNNPDAVVTVGIE